MLLFLAFTNQSTAQILVPITESGQIETSDFGLQWKEIRWTKDNQVMVLIPAGTYQIGRAPNIALNVPVNQTPISTVTVGSYYIDKTEVSNFQYNAQVAVTSIGKPRSITNLDLLKDEHPVIGITWTDSRDYALSIKKDLPTEAEWEIAARGQSGYLYPWGNEPQDGAAAVGSGSDISSPVGTNPLDVSGFGVFDMAGNVSEWVKDNYLRDYYSQVDGKSQPEISELQESKSIRGGNYFSKASDGVLTFRNSLPTLYSRSEIGFRTVFRLQKVQPTPTPTPIPPTPTPTPDPKVLTDEMQSLLTPYFENPELVLPSEFVRLAEGGPSSPVLFFNQSPFPVVLGFIDPFDKLVFRFPTTIEPYAVQQINLPTKSPFEIFASATGSEIPGIYQLGKVNSLSNPFVVMSSKTFAKTVRLDGSTTSPIPKTELAQFYGKTYQPDWNVVEVFNSTSSPVEVRLDRVQPDRKVLKTVTLIIDVNEVGIFDNYPGTDLQVSAKYLGAKDEANSAKLLFKTNKTQDRCFFTLFEDNLGKTYTVQLSVLPEIGIRKVETKILDDLRKTYVLD